MTYQRIGVIGAGSWGTALALVAARAGRDVTLWARDETHAAEMAGERENARYLPDMRLPDAITPTAERDGLGDAEAVLLVVPAQTLGSVAATFAAVLPEGCPVVICAKGIEHETGYLMSEVLGKAMPGHRIAVLSGPTFAAEVAKSLPTAVTLACEQMAVAMELTRSLAAPFFRPYASGDVIGVEIAGAMKNVIAIACGIAVGRDLGQNARASLITRGLAEMQRLVVAKGGMAPTLMGLSGVGDLTLTCSTEQSRNFAFGMKVGRGMPVAEAKARPDVVVEGVHTAAAVPDLVQSLGIEMPICEAVARVLHEDSDIGQAMAELLSRPLRPEGG
jgi:glycerol-3-phosphate dehydrogenase (NAD(P)+)